MANKKDNLIPQAHKLTVDEASKGGKASAEARRNKRDLRNALEILLESNVTVVDKATKEKIIMTGTQAITSKLFEQAMKGNVKAFKTIRETVGQDPVQKIEVARTDPEIVAEVEQMIYGDE